MNALPLDPIEIRVIGSLMEKQLTTPEVYPLTLNGLTLACNQKTNREPVTSYSEKEIERALAALQGDRMVWRIMGGRVTRWEQGVERAWSLDERERAIMTMLFLRGAQTPGDLRNRSERLYAFASLGEVEEALQRLSLREPPLVRELPRRPGQKEPRWTHIFDETPVEQSEAPVPSRSESLSGRVDRLEEALDLLASEVTKLKQALGAE